MLPLPISAADREALLDGLAHSHEVATKVSLWDRTGAPIGELSGFTDSIVEEGQVTVTGQNPISSALTAVLRNPKGQLKIDPDSPAAGALYIDTEISVQKGVRCRDAAGAFRWFWIPRFWGGLTRFRTVGRSVSLEAQSKELYGLAPETFAEPLNRRRGSRKADTIRAILASIGERSANLDIPDLKPKIPRHVSYHWKQEPWLEAKDLARALGKQLLARPDGTIALRELPDNPVFIFDEAVHLAEPAELDFDYLTLRNRFRIFGPEPQVARDRLTAVATAPRNHPLSPEKLGRNGKLRVLQEVIENRNLRTQAECQRYADRALTDALRSELAASFEGVAIDLLEPGDLIGLRAREYYLEFRLWDMAFPLALGQAAYGTARRIRHGDDRRPRISVRGDKMLRGKALRKWERRIERAKARRERRREKKRARKRSRRRR